MGSEDRVYYVHHGVLEAHPAFDARLKEESDQYEHAIDWSMFEEQTIECVLGYLYTGGYQAPPESSETEENEDTANTEEETLAEGEEEDGNEIPEEMEEEAEEGITIQYYVIKPSHQGRRKMLIQRSRHRVTHPRHTTFQGTFGVRFE